MPMIRAHSREDERALIEAGFNEQNQMNNFVQ